MKKKLKSDLSAMGKIITESGMDFVADNTFHIEKLVSDLKLRNVRSVEFVRVQEDRLIFVEAKTCFPNPDNSSDENLEKFQSKINEICEKFEHSLNLYSSIKVGVTDDVSPKDFKPPDRVPLVFVLVVKNHDIKWCNPTAQKLKDTFPPYLRQIWKPEVYVVNHEVATKLQLTVAQGRI